MEPYLKRIAELEEDNGRIRDESIAHATNARSLQSEIERVTTEITTTKQALDESEARVTKLEKTNRKLKEDFESRLDVALGLVESLSKPSVVASLKTGTALGLLSPASTSRTVSKENRSPGKEP